MEKEKAKEKEDPRGACALHCGRHDALAPTRRKAERRPKGGHLGPLPILSHLLRARTRGVRISVAPQSIFRGEPLRSSRDSRIQLGLSLRDLSRSTAAPIPHSRHLSRRAGADRVRRAGSRWRDLAGHAPVPRCEPVRQRAPRRDLHADLDGHPGALEATDRGLSSMSFLNRSSTDNLRFSRRRVLSTSFL